MSTFCTIIVGILCLNVPGNSHLKLEVGNAGTGALASVSANGWTADITLFADVVNPFMAKNAQKVCVKDVCIDYHRDCRKDGEATVCRYEFNQGVSTPLTVRANNDKAFEAAMRDIALYRVAGKSSDFPLSLLNAAP
jgi:hypothetical protein